GQDCIPWLGETVMKERLLRLCARGKIAINLRGLENLQAHPGEAEDAAWQRMRPKLSLTGRHLDDVFLMLPSAVPVTGGSAPPVPQPGLVYPDGNPVPAPGISESAMGGSATPVPVPMPGNIFGGS